MSAEWTARIALLAATEAWPENRVNSLTGISAALLAVSVSLFALLPIMVDLSEMRSRDALQAISGHKRIGRCFDLILASVVCFGLCVLSGLVLLGVEWYAVYLLQIAALVLGVLLLLIGVLLAGAVMRIARGRV